MKMFPLDSYRNQAALIDVDEARTVTYGELAAWEECLQGAIALPRALAFLFTQNDWRDAACYVSLANSGHAICLLDARLDGLLQQKLVSRYRPHLIFSQARGEWEGYEPFSYQGLEIARLKNVIEAPPLHPDLRLLSTSGTTGSPKMIRLSSRNVLSNAKSIIEYLGISPKERAIASLPIHYSYGLSLLNSHLLAGATTLMTRKSVLQADFWSAMHAHEGSSFAGVPGTMPCSTASASNRWSRPTSRR